MLSLRDRNFEQAYISGNDGFILKLNHKNADNNKTVQNGETKNLFYRAF